jgi:Zn-finger nucleic acid-binding protein
MSDPNLAIIPCPQCGVKNRIRNHDSAQIPVCARCRAKLMDENEHKAFQKFQDNLNQFKDFPDIGLRSNPQK